MKPVIKVFKSCVNLVLGYYYSGESYNDLKWLTPAEKIDFDLICMGHNIKSMCSPEYFYPCLNTNAIDIVKTRNKSHEVVNKNKCSDVLQYAVTSTWTKLSENTRNIPSHKHFKIAARDEIIEKRINIQGDSCDMSIIDDVILSISQLYNN
ncbi:unnamed protein product [Orchesella dallaii]|uniref:Uncharacterized protein n=1 Tax=Orchesella dallaii TaxID=48710 RepID=A0ABP1QPG7_9HEXA